MEKKGQGDEPSLGLFDQISQLREQIRILNASSFETAVQKKKQARDLSKMRVRFEQLQQQADALGGERIQNQVHLHHDPQIDYATQRNSTSGREYITALTGTNRLQEVEYLDQPPLSPTQIVITSGHLIPVVGFLNQLGETGVLERMTFIQGSHNPDGANQAAIVNTGDLLATMVNHRDNDALIQEVMKDVQQEISIMNVDVLARMIQREEKDLKEAAATMSKEALDTLHKEVWSLKYRMRRLHQMAGPVKKLVQDTLAAGIPISTLLEPGQVDGVTMDFDKVILASCDKNLLEGDYANPELKAIIDTIIAECNLHDQELASITH